MDCRVVRGSYNREGMVLESRCLAKVPKVVGITAGSKVEAKLKSKNRRFVGVGSTSSL